MSRLQSLRNRRVAARIPGHIVAVRAGISRGRLSEIERGQIAVSSDQLKRLEDVLRQLIEARQKVVEVAAECGWPMTAA